MLRMACQGSCTKMPEDCTTIVVSLFEAHEQTSPRAICSASSAAPQGGMRMEMVDTMEFAVLIYRTRRLLFGSPLL